MTKQKLDADALRVETFATGATPATEPEAAPLMMMPRETADGYTCWAADCTLFIGCY